MGKSIGLRKELFSGPNNDGVKANLVLMINDRLKMTNKIRKEERGPAYMSSRPSSSMSKISSGLKIPPETTGWYAKTSLLVHMYESTY